MKSINSNLVLIQTAEVESTGTLEQSEISREQQMKKQNRGTVVMVGSEVKWPEKEMVVSYYRAASADITDDDGTEYQLVAHNHVLAEF